MSHDEYEHLRESADTEPVAYQDGPNTYKMGAPSDVTSWTVIPTTRNAVDADGRGMSLRDEWWHVPTFVVDEIERTRVADRRPSWFERLRRAVR